MLRRLGGIIAVGMLSGLTVTTGVASAAGEDAMARAQDAAAMLARGNLQGALTLYSEALGDQTLSSDRRATLLNDRGVVYGRLNQPRQSIEDFNRAILLFPENPSSYNNRGNTLLALGLIKEALKDYDRALALAPGYAAVYNNRAGAYMRLGQTADAIRDYTKAIELMPASAAPLGGRGRALLAESRPDAALRDFSRALKADNRFAPAYRSRAEAHITRERFDEAIEDLSRALAFEPANLDLLMLRGRTYLLAGSTASAVKDYSRVLELDANRATAFEQRGYANAKAEAYDEAESDLGRAVELNPRSANAYAFRAWLYKLTGQPEVASREIDKAVRIDPTRPEVLWAKGEIAEATGRSDIAADAYRTALRADPTLAEARAGLQRLGFTDADASDADVPGPPVDGWRIVRRRDRYTAVNSTLGGLRIPLEMASDGVPRILEWDVKKAPFTGFGLLRFAAGQVAGAAGPEEVENVALINTTDKTVLAIEPHRRGAVKSTWTWADGKVTIAALDGVSDEFVLKAVARPGAVVATGPSGNGSSSVERRGDGAPPKWTTPEWAPWNDNKGNGGNRGAQRSSQSPPRKQKSLFDLIFGN
jgi:tetratricopeptide (TPR) repeat protein